MTGFSQPERQGLERTQRLQTAQVHPDADLLTAFSEQTLTAREREQMLTHLGVCTTCREVVSLASPPIPEALAPQAAADPAFWKWSILRWSAVAASAVIVMVAVSIGYRDNKTAKVAQITSDAAPISAPATSEQKAQREETPLQPPPSAGVKAPQIRYEKVAPKSRRDNSIGSLHGNLQADELKLDSLKKESDAPRGRAASGDMAFKRSPPVASVEASNAIPNNIAKNKTAVAASPMKAMADTANESQSKDGTVPPPPPPASAVGTNRVIVPQQSESVTVSAAAPPVNIDATVSVIAPKTKQDNVMHGNAAQMSALSRDKQYNSSDLKWQVSPEGYLQNSANGRVWNSLLTDKRFTHVQTVGNHVWACGPDGVLMHSTDGGTNWTPVTPTYKDAKLQGEISSIVFLDVNHGTLKTSKGETWTTTDAGQSWKKQ
jgi:hypothetical protein